MCSKDKKETIGARIKYIRSGQSREQFAEMLGIHKNTLANYEKDLRAVDSNFLTKLYKLDISPTWVVAGTGPIWLNLGAEHHLSMLEDQGLLGSDSENHSNTPQKTIDKEKSTTYIESDQNSQNGSSDPIANTRNGSQNRENRTFSAAELGTIGDKWFRELSLLSSQQREAVLTVVFNHVIAKFINVNMDKETAIHNGVISLEELLELDSKKDESKQKEK